MAFRLLHLLILFFANVAFSFGYGVQKAPAPNVTYFGTMHLTFGDFLVVGNTPVGSPIITATQAGNITGPDFEDILLSQQVQATGVSPATGSETDLPSKMYLRPSFETGAEKYFYMNYMVSTALVRRNGLDLTLDIWEVTWPNV
ncbi:hypothetical protein TARUN_8873 [Trichoderma arundinaceum]|uniref:Uncharacterized protein n=1 Tax=Trichoderma arundinaceum TaxID=490622 RepID=A0A395NB99_TRIAR|nr:hypothetical protein TARUN_8873 [Trichoderma arundinaceum]